MSVILTDFGAESSYSVNFELKASSMALGRLTAFFKIVLGVNEVSFGGSLISRFFRPAEKDGTGFSLAGSRAETVESLSTDSLWNLSSNLDMLMILGFALVFLARMI